MPRVARLGPVQARQMHGITMSRGNWSGSFDRGVLSPYGGAYCGDALSPLPDESGAWLTALGLLWRYGR